MPFPDAVAESGPTGKPSNPPGMLETKQAPRKHLTSFISPPQNIANSVQNAHFLSRVNSRQVMMSSQPSQPPPNKVSREQCKHPLLQIVSRDVEPDYVECQESGDVFESSELKDMAIEEKKEPDEEE